MKASRPGLPALILCLAEKELKVRYKRSLLGFAWFLLKPLFQTAVFSVVFTRIIRFGGGIEHYPLFLLTGLLGWNFLSSTLNASTTTLIDNNRLIRSIRFPRAALPAAGTAANAFHLASSLVVVELLLIAFGRAPGPSILLLPAALALFALLAAGLAMALSVWNVLLRDVAQLVEVVLLAWFYASPVIYPLDGTVLPAGVEAVVRLNPVSGFLQILHSVMYAGEPAPAWSWISLACWSAFLFASGLLVFRRAETMVVKEL